MANETELSYPSAFCQQFFDRNGKPLAAGRLYTYKAGSNEPAVTYKTIDNTSSSANRNTNPIILDNAGYARLVIENGKSYKFVLCDRHNTKIMEWDDVTAGGGSGGGGSGEYEAELPLKIVNNKLTNNGNLLTVTGNNAWAEGERTEATAGRAHAEGYMTKASGADAHAEGSNTRARGEDSHAEGAGCTASGKASHAGGRGTRMSADGGTAIGNFNADDTALFVVGDGTDGDNRSDAFKVDSNGRTFIKNENGNLVKIRGAGIATFTVTQTDVNTYTYPNETDVRTAVTNYDTVILRLVKLGGGFANYILDNQTTAPSYTWVSEEGSSIITLEGAGSPIVWTWSKSSRSIGGSNDIYGTLQDAIADAASLNVGDYFETNGFHTSGDGGAARYVVSSTGTANGMDIVQLAVGKLAVLQINNDELYPEQVGCIAEDSTFDCTTIFNYIWTICHTIKLHAKRYWFNGYLTPPIASKIIGDVIYSTDQFTQLSELATKRSGDYFIYLEHKEVLIENVMVTNRSDNGSFPDVSTGGVGIRCNDWGGDTSHFGYTLKHLRIQGFRKGIEFQGSVKWNVNLDDIRVTRCYIGIEFGESTFATRFERIHTDRCTFSGINIHGEANIGFYDCNFGSVSTAISIELYAMSNYHNAQLNFYNCNFECDDQTITNDRSIYFNIDDGVDTVINLSGCRFIQNPATNVQSNRCIGLGKNTMINLLGCELRNNTGSVYDTTLFWDENRPPIFAFGSIKFISSNVGIPRPSFTESKYDKCVVSTDDDTLEMIAIGGGGVIGHNLYDNTSPIILAGYVSEASSDHPTGLFTLNNSTQVSLAIPITSYMEGKTIRISAASTSHNRWKIGKHSSLPVSSYTDITYLANTYTSDSGRDYTDISISVGETGGYILIFFGSAISTTDFTDSVMACESPYYTPYESYSGGSTTYIVQLKTNLINLDELVAALNIRGNSLV